MGTHLLGTVLTIAVLFASLGPSSKPQLEANFIIERSAEANARDWKANPEYDYFERDRTPRGDTRTYEYVMIDGSPYGRLILANGKPLSPEQQSEEKRKFDAEIARRRSESPEQRAARIAKFQQGRERDHIMMQQMTKAFTFKLVGEQKLGPYDVYVLKAVPNPDYQPPNMESEALKGMQGKLWIDTATFQWVRVRAEVTTPVSIEGVLARVEPGTHFELEKMPVDKDIWLPKHFEMKAEAKVFFLFPHNTSEDATFYGYQKASSNSGFNNH